MAPVPEDAVLEPLAVGFGGIHPGDAVIDGNEHSYGEHDGECPDDNSREDEQAGAGGYGTMLVGCAAEENKSKSVPEGHDFAEMAGEWGGCMGVRGVV